MTEKEIRKLISETVQEELEKLGLKTQPKKPEGNVVDFFSFLTARPNDEASDDDPPCAA
jgi:hypothetical protein